MVREGLTGKVAFEQRAEEGMPGGYPGEPCAGAGGGRGSGTVSDPP